MRPRADLRVSVKTGHWAAINCRNYHTRAWKHIEGDPWENNRENSRKVIECVSHLPSLSRAPSNRKEFSHSFDSKPPVEISFFWHYPRSSSIIDKDAKCTASWWRQSVFRNDLPPLTIEVTTPFVITWEASLYYNRLYKWSTGVRLRPNFITSFSLSSPLPIPDIRCIRFFERGHDDWRSLVIIVSNNDNRSFECNYTCRNILSYVIAIGKKILYRKNY